LDKLNIICRLLSSFRMDEARKIDNCVLLSSKFL
jgi:hypothetical protein